MSFQRIVNALKLVVTVISPLWRNWPVHNIIAHPLSELLHWATSWLFGSRCSGWVHDVTIPRHEKGTGRG